MPRCFLRRNFRQAVRDVAERGEIGGWDIEIEFWSELLHLAFVDESSAQGVVTVDDLANRVFDRRLVYVSAHVQGEGFVESARCIVT